MLYLKEKRNLLINILAIYIFSFLLILPTVSYTRQKPWLCGDESGYMLTGRKIFRTFFLERDVSNPVWKERLDNYGKILPRMGMYVIGFLDILALKIQEFYKIEYLIILRTLIAFLSAACVVLLYLVIRINVSNFAGIIAAGMLLGNPYFRMVQTAVMLEIPMFFFALLALLSLVILEKKLQEGRPSVKLTALFGVFAGFAISCKLSAVALYPVFLFVMLAQLRRFKKKQIFLTIGLAVALGFGIFVISNPLLYRDFFEGIKTMTIGHIECRGGRLTLFNTGSLKNFLLFPFIIFKAQLFDLNSITMVISVNGIDYMAAGAGYILCAAGIITAINRKKITGCVWAFSCFAIMALIFLFSLDNCHYLRLFFLPSVALIWVFTGVLHK